MFRFIESSFLFGFSETRTQNEYQQSNRDDHDFERFEVIMNEW